MWEYKVGCDILSDMLNSLFGTKSYPLNKIYLSKERLIANYQYLAGLNPDIQIAPVLKSNAYGHGIEPIGQLIDAQKPPFICVDSLLEAYQLQKAGVKSDILIMGYVDPRSLEGKKLPFSYAVIRQDQLIQIKKRQPQAKIHLFVDTGMNREGSKIDVFLEFVKFIKEQKIEIEGLMTHLSMPRKSTSVQTKLQLNNFRIAKLMLKQEGITPKWFHLGGTYTLIQDLGDECNLIRCGKGIYGFGDPSLQPVLSMYSKIIQWKQLKKGDNVGYDATFTASKNISIAVLPIGYNDGVDRRLGNKGAVSCNGHFFPIIGRVSMNLMVIDVSKAVGGINTAYDGAEVEIISSDPKSSNSIQNIANICQTIPEEILVHLHPSTRREIV